MNNGFQVLFYRHQMGWIRVTLRFVPFVALLALIASFFCILYIAPIAGDIWGYRAYGLSNPNLIDLFRSYIAGYFHNNPRLGQFALYMSGYSNLATALVGTVSIIAMMLAAVTIASGNVPRPSRLIDVALIFIFLSILIGAGREIGLAFFYIPFNTNYVFGIALLLSHIAIFRTHQRKNTYPSSSFSCFLYASFGFLAGLSNEHTIPIVLGICILYIGFSWFSSFTHRPDRFFYSGFIGLFIGYLALYLAPGQNTRYGGVKNDGFVTLLADLPERIEILTKMLFADSIPFFLLAIVFTGGLYLFRGRSVEARTTVLWSTIMLIISFGMAFTVLASPKLGQRLMFSSYVCLAISITSLVWYVRTKTFALTVVLLLGLPVVLHFMATSYSWYSLWNRVFYEQADHIAKRITEGKSSIILHPYNFDFKQAGQYVRRESFSVDPQHRLNKLRARIYGVEEISFVQND